MTFKHFVHLIIFCFAGIIVIGTINFFLIEQILIPDPCLYHTHEPSFLFGVFYVISASEGYHPFPSTINLSLTILFGILVGYYSWIKTKK